MIEEYKEKIRERVSSIDRSKVPNPFLELLDRCSGNLDNLERQTVIELISWVLTSARGPENEIDAQAISLSFDLVAYYCLRFEDKERGVV